LKRTDGSFSGTSEAEGIILCPLFSKNFKNLFRISDDVIPSIITQKYKKLKRF